MYIPNVFQEGNPDRLFGLIGTHGFGLLVSNGPNGLEANPLPFVADPAIGPRGVIWSHMARANPQWKGLDGREVLAVFPGPHAYVSPTWQATPGAVPTWNYAAVHVRGKFVAAGNDGETRNIPGKMVRFYESTLPDPWRMDRLSEGHFDKLTEMIVGFRIEIDRMEGKWKLGQNHPPEGRQSIAAELGKTGSAGRDVARLMKGD